MDSSVLIRVLRSRPPTELADRTRELIEANAVAINDVIRLELELGCRTDTELSVLRRRLTGLLIFPVKDETWKSASEIGFQLRRQGVVVAVPNLLISTTAIDHDLVLVHHDRAFDEIANRTQLRVESYSTPTL